MNSTRHKDFYELRFLLHGSREHYQDEEPLYTKTSTENSVWENLTSKVLEPWRIIPTSLTENIRRSLWESLNIQAIKPKNIIAELSPKLITASDFKSSQEIEEVLKEICENDRQDLWKGLALHEDVKGNFVSIDNQTYLENPKFKFDPSFQNIITLIKRTGTRQQQLALQGGWITEWAPQRAIAVALDQPQPQDFCSMLLNFLDEADENLLSRLKQTKWLPLHPEGLIAPENVIFLPAHLSKELERGLEKIFRDEESSYVSLSMLAEELKDSDKLKKICSTWYENHILKFLLNDIRQPFRHCKFILKVLESLFNKKQALSKENRENLKNKLWLVDRNKRPISPQKVINFSEGIKDEARIILEQVEPWDYVTNEMLRSDISFCLTNPELREIFVIGQAALKELGEAIDILPKYYIGNFTLEQITLDKFLKVFGFFEELPVLRVAQKISEADFQEYILPQTLQPIDSERLVKIFQWIAETYKTPSEDAIAIYNQYLELACRDVQKFGQEILPHIKLFNEDGRWKSPNELCDGKNCKGIDEEYLLRKDQRQILNSYLDRLLSSPRTISAPDVNNSIEAPPKSNAKLLEGYFRPWLSYVPSEAIGSFLCLLAGTDRIDPEIEKLAIKYLRKQNFNELRKRLIWRSIFPEKNFTISLHQGHEVLPVTNLLGSRFYVKKLTQKPEHLFIGELTQNTTKLTLIDIQPKEFSSNALSKLLLESARIFIERINETQTNNESLDEIWKDISTSTQIDIGVSRDFILENSTYILATLGVKNIQITTSLKNLQKLKYDFIAKQRRHSKNIDFQSPVNNNFINEIKNLIETDEIIKKDILEAVRKKIGQGQYGYNVKSIPFELFQNADDSLVELERMLGNIDVNRQHYILEWDTDSLTLMHWGRAINLFIHPDARDKNFEGECFDRDLVNMLSFNISDKSEGETGKFGLGFKTVHLISKEPKVISGDLSFAVHAGLLPVALPRPAREQEDCELLERLRNRLKSEQPSPDITDGTLIHLEIDPETNTNVNNIVNEFESKIGLLLVFAKFIKTCKLTGPSSPKEALTWNPAKDVLGISGIEFGQIKIPQTKQNIREWVTHNLLCFRIQEASVAIALPEKLSSQSLPLLGFPTFWVTAPTKEELGLSFVINAKFDVTTGRTSLDRNSKHNQELAKAIGQGLAEKICELFKNSQGNWETLRQSLKLKDIDEYTFWEFLWKVLAVDWLDWLKKGGEQTTMQIVQAALGGKDCGIGYLISNHAALPNGLYGNYRQLVLSKDIKYIVEGILTTKQYFEKVINWPNFQQKCLSKWVIHHSIWQYVRKLIGIAPTNPQALCLADALAWELGNKQICSKAASVLGEIVTSDFVKSLQTSHPNECDRIRSELKGVRFESEDKRHYILASKLLIPGTSGEEEALLAAFAPNCRLLHRDYLENSLKFFRACREQGETIDPNEIVDWAIAADTDAKKQAVRDYLLSGERKQAFTTVLRKNIAGTWMENDPIIQKILELNSQQERLERANKGEIDPADVAGNSSSDESNDDNCDEAKSYFDRNDIILLKIYEWWQKNNAAEFLRYNERLYPINIEKLKQGLQERDRSTWLMLFFLGFGHRMGRTQHESHRNFIQFCLNKRWWQTFSGPNPQNCPKGWMNVLNEYMESQSEDSKWNYWMEKFPSIYRTAYYLEAYIESFLAIDKLNSLFDLHHIIAPRVNPAFQGGGPDAPLLNLGIGVNFVVRELVRLGILQANEYIIPHSFVPRYNVRRVLKRLGCDGLDSPCYSYSKVIYDFLCDRFEKLSLEKLPTFQNAFDIPFELYSEDSSRAEHLRLNDIDIKEDYEFNEEKEDS